MSKRIKTGLLGIGLETYWGQFEGLLEKLLSVQGDISDRLSRLGSEVTDAGMVDSPEKAITAAELFNALGMELIVINISTYALSHNVLPLLQRISAPVLVLNLQPSKSLDFDAFNSIGDRGKMTGEWLSMCQSCVTPELATVFNRAGIRYHLITGYLDEEYVWKEIDEWIEACRVRLTLLNTRVGVIGHYYNGMLDVYSDLTMLASVFGSHFELMEFGGLKRNFDKSTETEIQNKIGQFRSWFEVSPECSKADLSDAAKGSIALDKLADSNKLGSIAFYYEGEGDPGYRRVVASLIPGMTLLTGHNIPVAGECEIKNVLAMKILDSFDCGGSFSEFYLVDYEKDEIILGHDGPAHYKIAVGKPGLIPLPVYHGKPGKGLSIQMKVAEGPVTLLSVCQGIDGKITLLTAEGRSVAGPTMKIANTNSRYKFPVPAREFINRWSMAGPSHHCAIGKGHISGKISKLADLMDTGFLKIC